MNSMTDDPIKDHSAAMDIFDNEIQDMSRWVEKTVAQKFKNAKRAGEPVFPSTVKSWMIDGVGRWFAVYKERE